MNVVCGILVREDGKVLICQRGEGRSLAGLWEFPGGKIEAGESPQQALVRELSEELGIEVRVGKALTAVDWSDEWSHLRLLPFLCIQLGGEIELREHQAMKWIAADAWDCDNWAPADLPICRELQDLAYKHGNLLDMCQ